MKNLIVSLLLLSISVFTFGQSQDFDPSDIAVLKTIRDNAEAGSQLKVLWGDGQPATNWEGVTWSSVAPKKVIKLRIDNRNLVTCDVSKLDKLELLTCGYNNNNFLNVFGLSNLRVLDCSFNRLSSPSLNSLVNLEELTCKGIQDLIIKLTTLDVAGLKNLQYLDCSECELTSLNVTGLSKLNFLKCSNNYLPYSNLKQLLSLQLSPLSMIFPQREVFRDKSGLKLGDIIDYSSEASINGTATVFTWFKNSKKIEGTDQSGKYKPDVYGTYYCTMTNTKFPGSTITTYPVSLNPVVVDNSKWFPPVRSQQSIPNCTHFSLIYYLKSAIWNKQFNRDPKLEENQFNHNFVWNQNVDPTYKKSDQPEAFYFMKNYGCAMMSDFSFNEETIDNQPSLAVKEKALSYKSKRMFSGAFFGNSGGNREVGSHIKALKDSLSQGKFFSLDIPLFNSFFGMNDRHNVYDCYSGTKIDSVATYHAVTIMGYNDTIKTAQGRGAFMAINSNDALAHGIFYLDYNWFYFAQWYPYGYYFLEEDFSHQAKMAVNISLINSLSGKNLFDYVNLFVDTLRYDSGKKFDFSNVYDYFCNQNQIQVIKVNNKKIKLREKTIIKPLNNLDGNYELISDISDLSSVADFKSVSVVVFDPISANYIGADGKSFYSYTREAKASVERAYLSFLGTDRKIIAKVKDLSDTTIVVNDFTSIVAGLNLKPFQENIYVKSCTSVLKRKLITFSIEDVETNTPLAFIQVASNQNLIIGNTFSYKFIAQDPENKAIAYSITSGTGASINSSTGDFSFISNKLGDYSFTVKATDGVFDVFTSFKITVLPIPPNEPPVFTKVPPSQVNMFSGDTYKFKFEASDPENDALKFSTDQSVFSFITITISENTGEFSLVCQGDHITNYPIEVRVSDAQHVVRYQFHIQTAIKANNPPVFATVPALSIDKRQTLNYQFQATDAEGDQITFSLLNPISEATITSTGWLTFLSQKEGTFNFVVVASDGRASTNLNVSVEVKIPVGFREIDQATGSFAVHPNPFMNKTTIEFELDKGKDVNLAVYNQLGQLVSVVASGWFGTGKHTICFDGSGLAEGIYIVQLQTNKGTSTIKMVKSTSWN